MKLHLNTFLKSTFALIAAIALPSCLESETTVTLEKDGSGTIVEETVLEEQMLQMMTQFAQPGAPEPMSEMFNEEKAKARATELGEGVEFVKMEVIDEEGRAGARMHYKFSDINDVSLTPGDAVEKLSGEEAPAPKAEAKEDSAKFEYADGKLKIIVPATDYDAMAMSQEDSEQNPQMEEMMNKMLADMRITMKIVIAPGIETSEASYTDGDTITLFDVEVGKMMSQKGKLKKISELSKTDKDAAEAEFKKLEGMKIETKRDVTVTLK